MNAAPPLLRPLEILPALVELHAAGDSPARLSRPGLPSGPALVELFTADEQRARSSRLMRRSAVGDRLRVRELIVQHDGVHVVQVDDRTGLRTRTVLLPDLEASTFTVWTKVTNTGSETVTITALTIAAAPLINADEIDEASIVLGSSEWLAEQRWQVLPLRRLLPNLSLPVHGQDARGGYVAAGSGSWSTGSAMPVGVLLGRHGSTGWQIESSAPWSWQLTQTGIDASLTLAGPSDSEHHFAVRLGPGDALRTDPATIAMTGGGLEAAIGAHTIKRRKARRPLAAPRLPVIYNDFMNTLMGEPSAEALEPLIDAASQVGAEVFCIDAGWFGDPAAGDWFAAVGAWQESRDRFPDGLAAITQRIRRSRMTAGLWLEPEAVGSTDPLATSLPDDGFFQRFGRRIREQDRFLLDLRHPAARAHLDATVDRLVDEYGIGYLKLDHNIDPGPGTDAGGRMPGAGLLDHTRAYRAWLSDLRRRHPDLILENCASGGMRADWSLVSLVDVQSTSDQQDYRRYAPIAASAPMTLPPEQAANWAYPAAAMSIEQTVFTLVTGLAGRPILSGFLHRLQPDQQALVSEAVDLWKQWRMQLVDALPIWPAGLPDWDADLICVVLRTPGSDLVLLLHRGDDRQYVRLPSVRGRLRSRFPAVTALDWDVAIDKSGLHVRTSDRWSARALWIDRDPHPATTTEGAQ